LKVIIGLFWVNTRRQLAGGIIAILRGPQAKSDFARRENLREYLIAH
jgi:hypothetical protein